MKVIVTGGAGFIGSHITRLLTNSGHIPLVIDTAHSKALDGMNVEQIFLDIRSPKILALFKQMQPDVVIHAAAQVSVARSMTNPSLDHEINVMGTRNLLHASHKVGLKRFVFLSTGGGIYGETPTPANEDTIPRPKSYYSAHKYLAERYVEFSGISFAVARLSNVYGPGQRSDADGGVVAIFTEKILEQSPIVVLGTGEQSRDFIHVDDVARAILDITQSDLCGTWNVGSSTETTILELLSELGQHVPIMPEVKFDAGRKGDVFRSCLDSTRLTRDFDWSPEVTLQEGLRNLLNRS